MRGCLFSLPVQVSRFGLAVRHQAGKQKDASSLIPFPALCSQCKLWFVDRVLVTLPLAINVILYNGSRRCPYYSSGHSDGDGVTLGRLII